jgi:flagellum-specific ATP synthase
MPACNSPWENQLVSRARAQLATFEDMAELIRLGAYRAGSDAKVDEAIRLAPQIEQFLTQDRLDRADMADGYQQLAAILDGATS